MIKKLFSITLVALCLAASCAKAQDNQSNGNAAEVQEKVTVKELMPYLGKDTVNAEMLTRRLNVAINDLEASFKELSELGQTTAQETDQAKRKQLRSQLKQKQEDVKKYVCRYAEENKDNVTPAVILSGAVSLFNYKELVAFKESGAEYTKSPIFSNITQTIDYLAPLYALIGKPCIDFTIKDKNGKSHTLKEYTGKGKYVLLDFWASWCGPCMREVPHMRECYAQYHSKGFDIVGVSLDSQKDAWQQAVTNNKMSWHQLSSLQGWDDATAKAYGVTAIPANYLIDENGTIIDANLRGENLLDKLEELLEK